MYNFLTMKCHYVIFEILSGCETGCYVNTLVVFQTLLFSSESVWCVYMFKTPFPLTFCISNLKTALGVLTVRNRTMQKKSQILYYYNIDNSLCCVLCIWGTVKNDFESLIKIVTEVPLWSADINECKVADTCGPFSNCHNTNGSYHCSCQRNYVSSTGAKLFQANQTTCLSTFHIYYLLICHCNTMHLSVHILSVING